MRVMTKVAGIASCACLFLGAAPLAAASGGRPATGGGTTATGGGAGGAPGGGGSATSGGVKDIVPPPAIPCASLVNVSAPVGYYLTHAAVWNDFTVKNCSTGSEVVNYEVTETNTATGAVEFDMTSSLSMTAGQNLSQVVDNDFAPFNTAYSITYKATDASGNVLATSSTSALTPPPR